MVGLADVMRHHGPAYLERYRANLLPSHARAITAIMHCRTPALGGHLAVCTHCERYHVLYHSCRNRACPRCGWDITERWLAHQQELLLPVPYFHVVFTIPAELRQVVRQHQKALLPVLFRAAYAALAKLCAADRFLGGQIGALAVLHTWTRTLNYHPHIHMLVPGGALSPEGVWKALPRRRKRFLVPVRALAKVFAGKFMAAARRALPDVALPYIPYKKRWVVFAKPVVHGTDNVLRYLGRYVHRTAIGDSAIIASTDTSVTFQYQDSRTYQRKTMTLAPHEFLRRFLQHVLPKGLHRVRAYGLLHPAHRTTLKRLQLVLATPHCPVSPAAKGEDTAGLACPRCGVGTLLLLQRLTPDECHAMLANEQCTTRPRAPPSTHRPAA